MNEWELRDAISVLFVRLYLGEERRSLLDRRMVGRGTLGATGERPDSPGAFLEANYSIGDSVSMRERAALPTA